MDRKHLPAPPGTLCGPDVGDTRPKAYISLFGPQSRYAVSRLAADTLLRGCLTDDRVWGFVRTRYSSDQHRPGVGGCSSDPGSWNEAAIAAHDQGRRRAGERRVGSNSDLGNGFGNLECSVIGHGR